MNPSVSPAPKPRRHVGRWIAVGLLLMLTPLIVVGVGVLSMVSLDPDAKVLRREVMAATDAHWNTKVQVSAGWLTLGAVRTVLGFIEHDHMDEARLAMAAVRKVSVGVYERSGRGEKWSRKELLAKTDERMRQRGWSRLVGVTERGQAVLVYTSDRVDDGDRLDLCIAVIDGGEMVIVSAKVEADSLMELAERHMPEGGFREKLRSAKLNF